MRSDQALKYGVFAGILTIIYLSGIYLYSEMSLEKQLMVHPYVTFSRQLIYLFFMFLAIKNNINKEVRSALSEYIKPAFVTFLVANLIFYVFYYVMFKHIDTSLMDASLEYMNKFMPDQKEQGIPGRENPLAEVKSGISLSSTIFAYVREIILGFVLSGLLALIYRRR